MEISAEKTKLMTKNISGINTEIKVNGQKLETVTSFEYLGSVITDEGSKPEILSRFFFLSPQCSEIEENLRKNNSKRAYQLVKNLTNVKQGKATTVKDRSGKKSDRY